MIAIATRVTYSEDFIQLQEAREARAVCFHMPIAQSSKWESLSQRSLRNSNCNSLDEARSHAPL